MNPLKRWANGKGYKGNVHFWNAICKYGWDSFTHEIIVSMVSKEDAAEKERELIAKYKSNNPEYGYNITAGGETNILPKESLEKISMKNKGRVFSEETKKRMSDSRKKLLADHPYLVATRTGCRMSAEHRKILSDASREARRRPVECIETGAIYPSMTEASRAAGVSLASLCDMLHGKQKSASGFTWRYVEVVK